MAVYSNPSPDAGIPHGPPMPPAPPPGPRVTPAAIISRLSPRRLAEIAGHFNMPVAEIYDPPNSRTVAVQMLALLKDDEIKAVARDMHESDTGSFMELFRRLADLA